MWADRKDIVGFASGILAALIAADNMMWQTGWCLGWTWRSRRARGWGRWDAAGGHVDGVLAPLQRLRKVMGGGIRIDREDIGAQTDAGLRDTVGVVPQDVSLLNRPVLGNSRYGRPDATDDEVRASAEVAGCSGFAEKCRTGSRPRWGNRGARLSGAQRWRLAIVRAFPRDAPILLLDEATSALNTESEVQEALERFRMWSTVIAVAHPLSTLRGFDRIVVLDEAGWRRTPSSFSRGQIRSNGCCVCKLGCRTHFNSRPDTCMAGRQQHQT